jgi:hypothetical protein
MSRLVQRLVLIVVLALAVGGCGDSAPPSGTAAPDCSAVIEPIDLRYTCGEFSFPPGLVTAGLGNAEQANDPAAAALRAHLAEDGPEEDFLPNTGWHLVGMDPGKAEFVAIVPGGDPGWATVSVERSFEGWNVTGWGECRPRIDLAEGLGPAEWTFDPAGLQPGPATQVFEALVTELSCNSGQPADGRVIGPEIVTSADTVLLIFAVRPRPAEFQTCQANPTTRVTVDLGEPLGARKLFDGGRLPPGDPAQPRS